MSNLNKEKYKAQISNVKLPPDFQQKTARLLKNQMDNSSKPQKNRRVFQLVLVPALAVVLVCALLFSNIFNYNVVQASENLMNGIHSSKTAASGAVSEKFITSTADFSVALFQKSVSQNKNSLVAPVSVSLALGMTANGAGGNTLKQFQKVLGGGMSQSELNDNDYAFAKQLTSIQNGKLQIANSIWYRDKNLDIKKSFLQTNADYFGADAYRLDFSKPNTVNKINNWVKDRTGGKIDNMVDKIDDLTMMYLFNTLYFEADWQVNYEEIGSDMYDFQTANGNVKAQFLRSGETYIHDEKSDGMLKYFKDTKYAFVAVLPKKGISLEEYIKNMTGEEFLKLMDSGKTERAVCSLPKFKYDYSVDLSEPLQAMGLTDGFDDGLADFSRMGTAALGNLYIGDVLHKTFIQVDETGAKAGAATKYP